MIVANNIIAINAQRQFNIVGLNKKKSTEKLASGYKINRAADDAAGLTISEKMRSQIRGLHQASENCQDGVSYVQVADGALNEVHDMLQRMNELSVQSANGTNSDADRKAIDNEFQQLKSEMDRIFMTTEFNEKKIWDDDEVKTEYIQVGVENKIGVKRNVVAGHYKLNETNKLATPKDGNEGFKITADTDGIKVLWTGHNDIEYQSETVPWDNKLSGEHSFRLSDYIDLIKYPECKGLDFTYTYTTSAYASKEDIINCLNNDSLETVSWASGTCNYTTKSGISDGFYDSSLMLGLQGLILGDVNLEHNDSEYIKAINNGHNITSNPVANPGTDDKWVFEFDVRNMGRLIATTEHNPNTSFSIINPNLSDFITRKEDGNAGVINDILDEKFSRYGDARGTLHIGEFNIKYGSDFLTRSFSIDERVYEDESKYDIVQRLKNLDGISIIVEANTAITSVSNPRELELEIEEPIYEVKKEVTCKNGINIFAGASSSQSNIINIDYESLRVKKIGLENTNVLTEDSATGAINDVAKALQIVSDQRSYFGAVQNRMEHTIASLDNIVENTQAAESRIRDTDMAKEMVNLSLLNILEQAGLSMMSQANQSNQGVLSLLQ